MQALPKVGREVVDLVGPIDFYGFARRAQGHLAVFTVAQMLLQISAHLGRHQIIDQIVELGQKLSASHFSPAFFRRK